VCRCGNRGCLETVAGADAVAAALNSSDREYDVEDIVARASDGDVACTRVVTDTAVVIGGALATLVNLFNPQRLVIGGALAAAGALLLDPLRATIERAAVPSAVADLDVVRAELDERAEVAGAIALVLRDPTLTLPAAHASLAP
jgi:predicted NBD/HSP70 family sugar kinase